jgi:NAD(P)H-dependent nitrite reductase small subunit
MPPDALAKVRRLPVWQRSFVRLASVRDIPDETGVAVKYGDAQIAIFRTRGQWYATQNACSHSGAMVLARGIVGDAGGAPKVACPLHKRAFDLRAGTCLSKDADDIATFPVRIEGDDVYVELPPADQLRVAGCASEGALAS